MAFNFGFNNFYGIPQIYPAYGSNGRNGYVMQSLKDKYGCEDCFVHEPHFAHYPIAVQEVPQEVVRPSFVKKVVNTFLGG